MNLSDISFQTQEDAEKVLQAMKDIVEANAFVSIQSFYDLSDIRPDQLTYYDRINGWTDLSEAFTLQCKHDPSLWRIEFPSAVPAPIRNER